MPWPSLSDPARVAAKVALDEAKDRIDEFIPDRKAEVALIEEAAASFHTGDEYQHAATFDTEPLPVTMRRATERAAKSKEPA